MCFSFHLAVLCARKGVLSQTDILNSRNSWILRYHCITFHSYLLLLIFEKRAKIWYISKYKPYIFRYFLYFFSIFRHKQRIKPKSVKRKKRHKAMSSWNKITKLGCRLYFWLYYALGKPNKVWWENYFSISIIISTRTAWRPPSNSFAKKLSRISIARHEPITLAPMQRTFASLCCLVILAENRFQD